MEKKVIFFQPGLYSVCRFETTASLPGWALQRSGEFHSITGTEDEISVITASSHIPDAPSVCRIETGWRIIKIEGPIEFTETGVLSAIAGPLADAGIGIFAVSTFDTDYILIKEHDLFHAACVLRENNYILAGEIPEKSDSTGLSGNGNI